VSEAAFAGKYIALDCEMVGVGPTPDKDSQLARVSLVNWHGEQLYDTYVLPQLPVTDYRTHVSGIRPHNLSEGRPFKEVQSDVAVFLKGRILVGHYLKADMNVLGLRHTRRDIRDTSWLPKFREAVGGRSPRLKELADRFLGIKIHDSEHNSVEDARVAMLLYRSEKNAFENDARQRKSVPATQSLTKFSAGKKLRKKKRK
jgi:RNA exonuclease 4